MKKQCAKSRLIVETLKFLMREHSTEKALDVARYNAQLLEPVEFLRDVAGHILCLEPDDVFAEADIVEAVISVASARDALQSEELPAAQLAIPWRAWLHDGVRIQ